MIEYGDTDREILDCHVHMGWDAPDGVETLTAPYTWENMAEVQAGLGYDHAKEKEAQRSLTPEEIIEAMDAGYGPQSRCNVFPFNEGDRNVPDPDGVLIPFHYANDRVLWAANEYEGRFHPFCRVDPNGPAGSEGPYAAVYEVVRCRLEGAEGLKLHPRAQKFAADSDEAAAVARVAGVLGMPVLLHSQARPDLIDQDNPEDVIMCEPYRMGKLAEKAPDTTIIIGHSGCGGSSRVVSAKARTAAVTQAADVASTHENVYLDLSITMPFSLEDNEVEKPEDVGKYTLGLTDIILSRHQEYEGRILFGSDLPFGKMDSSLRTYERVAGRYGIAGDEDGAIKAGTMESLFAPMEDTPVQEIAGIVREYIEQHEPFWNRRAKQLSHELEQVATVEELESALYSYVQDTGKAEDLPGGQPIPVKT